jgi:hypothetical protein
MAQVIPLGNASSNVLQITLAFWLEALGPSGRPRPLMFFSPLSCRDGAAGSETGSNAREKNEEWQDSRGQFFVNENAYGVPEGVLFLLELLLFGLLLWDTEKGVGGKWESPKGCNGY